MEKYNLIVFAVFVFMIGLLTFKVFTINPKIIIKTKSITMTTYLFIFAAVLSILTLIVNHSWMDIVRTLLLVAITVLYLVLNEGLSEEGFYSSMAYHSYGEVVNYDVGVDKKKVNVYFVLKDLKSKKENEIYVNQLEFELNKQVEVEKFLKSKLNKKYKRLKKN